MKVEIYVKSIPIYSTETYTERGCEHTATGQVDLFRPESKLQFKKISRIPDGELEVLKIIRQITEEKGYTLQVYDISTFLGKVYAKIRGINKTPTIIIGKEKIEGTINKEQIVEIIKSKAPI